MEYWREYSDTFLLGLAVGLAVAIIISVTVVVSHKYRVDAEIATAESISAEEYEKARRALEGFIE